MNNEKKFLLPELEIIEFCDEDIITRSILDELDEDDPIQH